MGSTSTFAFGLNRQLRLLAGLALLAVGACKSSKPVTQGSVGATATTAVVDSIAAFRPRFDAPAPAKTGTTPVKVSAVPAPTHHVNAKLAPLLDTMAAFNKTLEYAQGYRVMVATSNNRDEAMKVKERLYRLDPYTDVYVTYTQPTFRVKAGDYLNHLEAQMMLARIKREFPGALIISDKVSVRPR